VSTIRTDRAARAAAFALALIAGAFGIAAARADCPAEPEATLPIVPNDLGSPIVPILIDDKPQNVLLDTGGFWSLINRSISGAYPVRRSPVQGLLGLQGERLTEAVRVPSVQVGPVRVPGVDFFEEPDGAWQTVATLGANWLRLFDVDIDPVAETVRLFQPGDCGADAVRWPHQDLAELPVSFDRRRSRVTVPVVLDGHEITALIDTGATETYFSAAAAEELFGLSASSPGAQPLRVVPYGSEPWPVYRYQFGSLNLGSIPFDHPWLVVTPISNGGPDMIIGMHQLHALHLYFAYRAGKLYATTAKGDIAARQATAPGKAAALRDPADMIRSRDFLTTASDLAGKRDYDGALATLDRAVDADPDYAQAYVERAEFLMRRGQGDRAIADLNRAVSLDPKSPTGLLELSEAYTNAGDQDRALADVDRAIALDPTSQTAYAVRAQIRASKGDWDRAAQDAIAAIRIDPKNPIGYLSRSHVYELKGDFERAFADADHAVALAPKSPIALNSRCWNGAILARLDSALADCDAALAEEPDAVEILDSRAFVNLQAGRFRAALADYNAALIVNPRFASSLYGRGLTKRRLGDQAGADADITAAWAQDPKIGETFGR
jgi:tetratricopeptide (TPR) repeat protein